MTRFPFRAALAAAIAAAALACGRGRARLEFPKAPVVLISVDTLRADHLPAFGYSGVETPNLDALRKDGVLFTSAYSQVPLTLPSHTSLLTGVYPAETGVRDNLGFHRLPSVETLPALLKKHGYATGGAVSSIVLTGESGMKDGFDLYDDAIEATAPGLGLGAVQRAGADTEKGRRGRSSRSSISTSRTRRTTRRSRGSPDTPAARTTARSRRPTTSSDASSRS